MAGMSFERVLPTLLIYQGAFWTVFCGFGLPGTIGGFQTLYTSMFPSYNEYVQTAPRCAPPIIARSDAFTAAKLPGSPREPTPILLGLERRVVVRR